MNLSKEKKPKVLDSGMWAYSRHPNHLGEQIWWVGIALFAFAVGGPWYDIFGLLFNHVLDTAATLDLNEKRMS